MKSLYLEEQKAYLRYIDTGGTGVTLVFLHGLGSASVADFSNLLHDKRFMKFRIILLDLLGHGFSDKPKDFGYSLYDHAGVIAGILDHLQVKNSILVGHSLGGTVAIALAQKRIDLVSKLILAEPNLDPGIGTGSKIIAAQKEDEFSNTGHKKYINSLCTARKNDSPESIYVGTFSIADPIAIHRSARGLLKGTEPPQRIILKSLSIPRLYIVGEQNINDVPCSELTDIGFTVFVVPDSGHAMMNDNPDKFPAMLLEAISA